MRNEIILAAIILAGLVYLGASDKSIGKQSPGAEPNRSQLIFDAVQSQGIEVTDTYTTNGSEIKKALSPLEGSNVNDDSEIAFLIFQYSGADGIDSKIDKVRAAIYAALSVDAQIDGVAVMAFDPSDITGRMTLVYTNRSYAEELAHQNLTLRKHYNSFDIYSINIKSPK